MSKLDHNQPKKQDKRMDKMSVKKKCPLCYEGGRYFYCFRTIDYYQCFACFSVYMDPACHLAGEEEKKRYTEHNNDIKDPGYRQFVNPLVKCVLANQNKKERGLDYGCGTGPVAASILAESDFSLKLYDPFFYDDRTLLQDKYDYIIAVEVIEHFKEPGREFQKLRDLLKQSGNLYCMTLIYDHSIDFPNWYYKNDPTHCFFYSYEAVDYIKHKYSFSSLEIDERVIFFRG